MSEKLQGEIPGDCSGVFVLLCSFSRRAVEKVSRSHGKYSVGEPTALVWERAESDTMYRPAPGHWASSNGGLLSSVAGVVFVGGDVISLSGIAYYMNKCLPESDRCGRIKHIKSHCKRGNESAHG